MGRYENEQNAGLIQIQGGAYATRKKVKEESDERMRGLRRAPPTKCRPMMGESGRLVLVKVTPQRKQPPPVKHVAAEWTFPSAHLWVPTKDAASMARLRLPLIPVGPEDDLHGSRCNVQSIWTWCLLSPHGRWNRTNQRSPFGVLDGPKGCGKFDENLQTGAGTASE